MEIKNTPAKSLTIQSVHETPYGTMVKNKSMQGGYFMWIDGVLIDFGMFPSSEANNNLTREGIIHWAVLSYCFDMKEYSSVIKDDHSNVEIPVYNMSYDPFYIEVGKYITSLKNE